MLPGHVAVGEQVSAHRPGFAGLAVNEAVHATLRERQVLQHPQLTIVIVAGPVAVQLEFVDAENVAAEPPLPLQTVLGSFEQRLVAKAFPADRYQNSRFGLRYVAAPGDPSASSTSER